MEMTFTDENFAKEVLQSDIPVMVDFFATWCGPCKAMAPIIEELAGEYSGKIKIGKLDVDQHPQSAGQFGIMSIPTIMFFKDGKMVKSIVGGRPKDALVEELDALLK